ncbi:helix-turn-helix domain-containing protein [Chungangia koreensis]|uniref:Helix-turn-helix domain-containing protein n=1 Tax=Chungangia koreensis TaxID=752657 RepID=A0ABV8X087_9LACT
MGTRLKEARIAKGFSLEDLQDLTKIQKRYLSGIENGKFDMMPGPFYVRAFIKQYAEAVDLNPDEMLELYKKEVPETELDPVQPVSSAPLRSRTIASSRNRFAEVLPKIIVALFIIVAIVAAWTFWQHRAAGPDVNDEPESDVTSIQQNNDVKPPSEGGEPGEDNETDTPPPEEEPAEPEQTQEVAFVSTNGQTSTYTLTGTEEFKLKITATGESWIIVTDQDGRELENKGMIAGETLDYDFTDQSSVRVRIGSTPNASLTINDQPLEYAVSPNEPGGVTQNIVIQFTKPQ